MRPVIIDGLAVMSALYRRLKARQEQPPAGQRSRGARPPKQVVWQVLALETSNELQEGPGSQEFQEGLLRAKRSSDRSRPLSPVGSCLHYFQGQSLDPQ